MKRAAWLFAAAAAVPPLAFPIDNPDLFWHLSAARWIIAHRMLPRTDWLSFTEGGRPWVDFEWLGQVLFATVHFFGGMFGLWALKSVLLAVLWILARRIQAINDADDHVQILGLALCGVCAFPFADLRPELFSLIFFALLAFELENERLAPKEKGWAPWATLPFFSLWSWTHPAWPLGLVLIGLYAAETRSARLGRALFASVLGVLINPYGGAVLTAIGRHVPGVSPLGALISEWGPSTLSNPLHWPFFIFSSAFACQAVVSRRREPLVMAALGLAVAALIHARLQSFFLVAAVAALPPKLPARFRRGLVLWAALCAAFSFWTASHFSWRWPFDDRFIPEQATHFIAGQRPIFETLHVHNEWDWGGYLGWTLAPWYRVSSDGRYIFHDRLEDAARASGRPETWAAFLQTEGANAALLKRSGPRFAARTQFPDGTSAVVSRPWHLFFMPRERWALVYADERALLFVMRSQVPAGWLASAELKATPDDEAFEAQLGLRRRP